MNIIDSILATIIMAILILAIKYGGAFMIILLKKTSNKYYENKKTKVSDTFPANKMKIGDIVVFPDFGPLKNEGKNSFDGKYVLACEHGKIDGKTYISLDMGTIKDTATELRCKHYVKWQRAK